MLKCVADRLRGCVDAKTTVARVGGDEFAIILSGMPQLADAAMLAQHIGETLRVPCDLLGHAALTDTSIGIAVAPDDGHDPDELLKNADLALYRTKADGRGSYRFFEPEMDACIKARRNLEYELRAALNNGEFVLHYQPILRLTDNTISCCEALGALAAPDPRAGSARRIHPARREIGLIVRSANGCCARLAPTLHRGRATSRSPSFWSPIQMGSVNLVPMVISALASARLPASRLDLEITESVMMQNTEATLAALHNLRSLGVNISMDDFGTGFSALSYLRRFPFDKLKIDRSFINDLEHTDANAIVLAVTTMAKSLGMISTAEGVETAEQLEQVRKLGCTEVQGYYISRPQPLAMISRVIAECSPQSRLKRA
ncbi:MAG: bifunctional diguanylate cyclase/phosphodiesterase [Pseudolabrys sp.]